MASDGIELKVHLQMLEIPPASGLRAFMGHFFVNLGHWLLKVKGVGSEQ
jgi:hypothetical protein